MRRVLGATIVAFALVAAPAYADKVVNNTGDAGTGTCTVSQCTLRDAVATSTGPSDPVIVPAGTYNLTQPLPLQLAGRTIVGAGARSTIIDGGGTNKVLYVSGSTNQVSGVTLRNGGGGGGQLSLPADGGAVLVTGTFAPANLTLTSVTVSGSHSSGGGGGIASIGCDPHDGRLDGSPATPSSTTLSTPRVAGSPSTVAGPRRSAIRP